MMLLLMQVPIEQLNSLMSRFVDSSVHLTEERIRQASIEVGLLHEADKAGLATCGLEPTLNHNEPVGEEHASSRRNMKTVEASQPYIEERFVAAFYGARLASECDCCCHMCVIMC